MAVDRELKAMEAALGALEPLDAEQRQRVVDWLGAKLGLEASAGPSETAASDTDSVLAGTVDLGTIKRFLTQKRPPDDVARATTLAYFLTHQRNQITYKTVDLTKARIEAALANLNMSRAVGNAVRAGYLTSAGKRGTYQVTSTGEALVEAMPDETLIKKVKAQGARRRKKSTGAKRPTAKKAAARKR